MKKLLVTILSILYLSTTFGATIHFHYCMNKLVYFGLESQRDAKCNSCGMEKTDADKECCKDDHKQLKVEDDQKITNASINLDTSYFAFIVHFFTYTFTDPVKDAQIRHFNESPPGKARLAVYLRNCVFLIWFKLLLQASLSFGAGQVSMT